MKIFELMELLNETILIIFRNLFQIKRIKCDYRQPPRMNHNVKRKLNQRTNLTKHFYQNGQIKCDHDKILKKSAEYTGEILEAKKNYDQ